MNTLKKYRLLGPLAIASVVAALTLVLEAYVSVVMMDVIDTAMSKGLEASYKGMLLLLGLAVLSLPVNLLMTALKQRYRLVAMKRMKAHYIQEVFKKDAAAFDSEHSADYITAMTQDMTVIENGFVLGIFDLVYQGMSFFMALAVIIYVSLWLPVMGLVMAAVVAGISILMGKPLKALQKRRSDLFQSYGAYIQASLSAFHLIRVNHLTDKASEDFKHKSHDIQHQGFLIDRLNTFIFAAQNLLMSCMLVGMMGAATYLTVMGWMTFGGVVLVINNIDRIAGPIQMLGEVFPKLIGAKALLQKHEEQLAKDQVIVSQTPLEEAAFNSALSLSDITFHYPETNYPVLQRASLTLEPGKKYLLVGPSGGGKSTILKLLRRYHTPTDGEILLDGKPLATIHPDSYYQLLGNVEQHVFLFEDTLRANLSLYKEIPEARMKEVLLQAGLQGLVDKLPQGLDTMIYDNGKNLSGGERSRIAIARALLLDAKILLLDEAFASLDDSVAKQIEEALLALEGVTLVHVTHVCFEENRHRYDAILTVAHQQVA